MTDWGEDEAVERVLRGLREAEGTPGMEARVLARVAALEGEEASPSASEEAEGLGAGWGRGWNLCFRAWGMVEGALRHRAWKERSTGGLVWAGIVLLTLVVGGGTCVKYWRHAEPVTPSVAGLRGVDGRDTVSMSAGQLAMSLTHADKGEMSLAARKRPRVWHAANKVMETAVAEADAGRKDRSAGVSFPATPMPLTEQERMLVELARVHDPKQIELLNTQTRTVNDAEESARFETFFRTPMREKRVLVVELKASDMANRQTTKMN